MVTFTSNFFSSREAESLRFKPALLICDGEFSVTNGMYKSTSKTLEVYLDFKKWGGGELGKMYQKEVSSSFPSITVRTIIDGSPTPEKVRALLENLPLSEAKKFLRKELLKALRSQRELNDPEWRKAHSFYHRSKTIERVPSDYGTDDTW